MVRGEDREDRILLCEDRSREPDRVHRVASDRFPEESFVRERWQCFQDHITERFARADVPFFLWDDALEGTRSTA